MIGETISHYKILDKLGEGGMGVVYKAQDTKLDRTVALKFLPHHLIVHDTERARFVQEAKAASALNHPNACVIHDILEHQGQQFMVMEYVEGVTLRKKIQEAPLKINEIVAYAIQIGEAIQEAHSKGVVHRDVKPENIMVNSKNQIKVMDFGLAKLKGSLKLTRTSTTVGTLAYMAPEQLQGMEVDARSDIFSFGGVLFEMLTGYTPFRGEHEAAIMYSIINEEPEPVQKYRPELSSEFLHVLNRALEKDPNDRYQSVNEMVIDLRRLKRESTKVSRKSLTEVSTVPSHEPGLDQVSGVPVSSPKKRFWKSKIGIGMALIILVVVALGMYKLLGPDRSEKTESFQGMEISRLTSTGKVGEAVISADGKYLVYTLSDMGKQSLLVRQLATGSNVQIAPPAESNYWGLIFSPDGNFLYYNQLNVKDKTDNLYQIPVLGGHPKKIIEDVSSPISLSPDGKRMVFYRWVIGIAEGRIVVANLDGSGERILIRDKRLNISPPAWSPDGKSIACGIGSLGKLKLITVPPEGGTEKQISHQTWRNIGDLTWLSDGRSLVLTATDQSSSGNSQIWQVAYPGGEAHRVTNDLNDYWGVSVTADGKMMVTVQTDKFRNIWVMPGLEAEQAKQITFGKDDGIAGVCGTPDGKIVYGSNASGSPEIWSMDADGSNVRQLTNDSYQDWEPQVSPDGRYIVFTSDRGEGSNIWRLDIDGSNLKQLSKSNHEDRPVISPDGKWVIYVSSAHDNYFLWKVPIDGGEPVRLTDKHSHGPIISPDGKLIACDIQEEEAGRGHKVAILPFEGGSPLKIIDKDFNLVIGKWMPSGETFCYAKDTLGVSNLFSLPLDGSPGKQLTDFKSTTEGIFGFDWSKDGKQLLLVRGTDKNDAILITDF